MTRITIDRAVVEHALEALELVTDLTNHDDEIYEAIIALRAALAEPVQEPVAFPEGYEPHDLPADYTGPLWIEGQVQRLYERTAPPQRKPLTEDQMNEAYRYIWRNLPDEFDHTASAWIETAIRYAERVHGIIETQITGDKDAEQKG